MKYIFSILLILGTFLTLGNARGNYQESVEKSNQFALDMYAKLSQKKGNVFFSPYSIYNALAMTSLGAHANTRKEMDAVLYFGKDKKHDMQNIAKLNTLITSSSKDNKFSLANALWGQKGFPFLDTFLTDVQETFDGGLYRVDFVKEKAKTLSTINKWVNHKTENKIQNLITASDINTNTRLILTNAIYFNGKWAHSFKKKQTRKSKFFISDKKHITIPMMFQKKDYQYYEDKAYQAIKIPYKNHTFSMLIVLPKNKKSEKRNLTLNMINKISSQLKQKKISLHIPKFKIGSKYYLRPILSSMGMSEAFNDHADFSKMNTTIGLKIAEVIHKAYISIDEEGTEAAAATAVIMMKRSLQLNRSMNINRPFVFLIRHEKTKEILFIGRINNPSE